MKARRSLIVISLLALSLTAVGESQWIAVNKSTETSYNKKADSDVTIVAYTRTNNVNTYYLTVESALEHTSSGTVYVIPGTNPTITRDCEIKSGVTLCIPYDDNGDGTHSDYTSPKNNQSNNGFADKDASAVAENRKNVVTIAKGITLTNNGTIDVAGKVGIGNNNQRPTGFTLGDYCEILMQDNAKILNNGSINLYGYIKESSSNNGSVVENSSTGSMKMPLVIYDYRGGSHASAATSSTVGTMPFNYYDFPNCHVSQIYNYGSKLTGLAVLYALSTYYSASVLVLGTDNEICLFKMGNGTNVKFKYSPVDCRYTSVDVSDNVTNENANYTYVSIEGDLKLSSMKISVGAALNIDTSKIDCVISYKYQITQVSGTLTIENRMKFFSGSSLTISQSAKCIMNAPVTFYQGYSPIVTTGIDVAKGGDTFSPQNMGRSKLLVNGTLILNSSFGGIINTEHQSGIVKTGENFVDSYITADLIATTSPSTIDKHIETAEAYMVQDVSDNIPSTFRLEKNKTYQLNGNYWETSNTDLTSFTLDKTLGKSSNKSEATYTITASIYKWNYASQNIIYNWSIDPEIELTQKENKVTFTTPAATSETITYTLSCVVSYTRKNDDEITLSLSGSYEAYYYESSGSCVLPTTLVLMADGSYKQAGLIEKGDVVISFNHETAKLEPNVIIVNAHKDEVAKDCNVLHLSFENGVETGLVYKHGYFDLDLNKYVYLSIDNYQNFIGHRFVYVDANLNRSEVKLLSGKVSRMYTKVVSPVTAKHLDLVIDNMLGLSSSLDGLFNIFEYDPSTLAFDADKMKRDIDKYGLLDYEYFKDYFPKEIYDLLPCKYLGVSIGKGLITWDIIKSYISKWKDQLMENMK